MTTDIEAKSRKRRPLSRRSRILLVLFAILLIDGIFIEPARLQVTKHQVTLPRLAPAFDGLRVVHLSDLHCGPSFFNNAHIRRAVKRANDFDPDLVLLTGDYVNQTGSIKDCARLLSGLHARYGAVAVLGNHDYWTDHAAITRELRAAGITVLNNEAVSIQRGASRLWIAGLDDAWEGQPNLAKATRGIPAGEPVILLVHEPDVATVAANAPIDLQLSGHVHGGQVRLPWIGPILTPNLGHKYPMGWYRIGEMQIYTSRGIGVTFPGIIRLNCPPELACLTLKAPSQSSSAATPRRSTDRAGNTPATGTRRRPE
ncbi:MAG: metallophosphoesterase [Armatimonadota bacterium]